MTFHTVGTENNKSGINNYKCCNLIPPHYYSNENLVEIFLINDSKEIWHFGTWKTEFLKSKIKSPISTSAFVNNSFFKNPHNCQSNENLVEKKRQFLSCGYKTLVKRCCFWTSQHALLQKDWKALWNHSSFLQIA